MYIRAHPLLILALSPLMALAFVLFVPMVAPIAVGRAGLAWLGRYAGTRGRFFRRLRGRLPPGDSGVGVEQRALSGSWRPRAVSGSNNRAGRATRR